MRRPILWLLPAILTLAACSDPAASTSVAPDVLSGDSSAVTSEAVTSEAVTSEAVTSEAVTSEAVAPAPQPLLGELEYEVVAIYPHSTSSFTQGLEFLDTGQLVESIGRFGESGRMFIDLETGDQIDFEELSDMEFAEGLTQVHDEIFQITWVSGIAIVSDAETLTEKRRYEYEGEGWGLCWNGTELAMSNGTADLTFRNPEDFSATRTVRVRSEELGLGKQLNELECVGDQVWANVYFKNHLIAIDPVSGEVEAWVDLDDITPEKLDNLDVMNGIAYRAETDTFFITGKNWAQMFELRFSVN